MGQISSHSLTPSLDGNLDKRSPYKDDVPKSIESEHTLESVRNIEAVRTSRHDAHGELTSLFLGIEVNDVYRLVRN